MLYSKVCISDKIDYDLIIKEQKHLESQKGEVMRY